jgi:hypothetical protein
MITVTPLHFTRRDQAIAQIRASGLHLVEAELSQDDLNGFAHVHPYDVDIYMLEGVFELDEPGTGLRHVLKAGCKAVVPAGTPHVESCPGPFKAAFGVSVDPAPLLAERQRRDP